MVLHRENDKVLCKFVPRLFANFAEFNFQGPNLAFTTSEVMSLYYISDTNISDEMVSQLKSYRLRWCFLILTFGLIGTCAAHDKKENGTISSGIPSMRNRPPYTFPGSYKAPEAEQVYHCGRFINDSRGFIHTPSFPKRFPVPILCRWVLKRPPGKKIVLYFTQFYMRESFHLTEYDSYTDEQIYRGRHELGTVSFEDGVTSFSVYKPLLVLEFQVSRPE